jgi:nicotinamidase-related amidase
MRMKQSLQALLVIDVQNEYFTGRLPVTYPKDSLGNILKAMDHAARMGIPIVVIQHTAPSKDSPTFRKGSVEWKLHPEVEKRKRDILIEKNLPGSFTGTDLEKWLREKGIDQVHLGLQVDFLSDATGTLSIQNSAGAISDCDLHRAVLVTMAMKFARMRGTEEWIAERVTV